MSRTTLGPTLTAEPEEPLEPREGESEDYYRRLWSQPGLDDLEPSSDERERWEAIRALLEKVPPTDGTLSSSPRILDLGCGRGWLTFKLSALGEVTGIDPLDASVEKARQLCPRLRFRRATADDLLGEGWGERFDLVVSSEVIEHVPDAAKPRFLSAAYGLLRPGGHLVLTTPRGELWGGWSARASRTQPVEAWIREQALSRLAQRAGFLVVSRDRAFDPRPPVSWQGFVLHRILNRKGLRRLRWPRLRAWLEHGAKIYQVVLLRRPLDPRF